MQTQHICKHCGQPVTLEIPDDLSDEWREKMLGLSSVVVHDTCADQLEAKYRSQSQSMIRAARVHEWGGICPPRYQDTDLSRFPQRWAERAQAWRYGAKGLVLHGPPRTGKTRVMFETIKREFLDGHPTAAFTATEWQLEARKISTAATPTQVEIWMNTVRNSDILFIDDLGKGRFASKDGWGMQSEELLFAVCEYRWTHNLPCMFTTNDVGDALQQRMSGSVGPAFVARLREFCDAIHCPN